jgi:GR25 family glycosyltransferase involved in LPS biosynthesis
MESLYDSYAVCISEKQSEGHHIICSKIPLNISRRVRSFNSFDITTDTRITTMVKMNILFKPVHNISDELKSTDDICHILSHIAVWESFIRRKSEYCLIFEEGCVIPDDFLERINTCITSSLVLKNPDAWNIWLLGGKWEDIQQCKNEFSGDGLVYIGNASLFQHAYILSRKTAKLLLKNIYPLHVKLDTWISIFAKINQLKMIGCTKIKLENRTKISNELDTLCKKCRVPINMYRTHQLISRDDILISQVFCILLILCFLYKVQIVGIFN